MVEGVALLMPALELVPAPFSERVPSALKVRSLAGVAALPKNCPRYQVKPLFWVLARSTVLCSNVLVKVWVL